MKSWPQFFDAIQAGNKKHDLRRNEGRKFRVGDSIILRRYDQFKGEYTGEKMHVVITFVTSNDTPCAYSSAALDRDYSILSLEVLPWTFGPIE